MKNDDYPGLAMSRSIGDLLAKSLGVIATPDTKIVRRDFEHDKCLVLCSDGVIEFLTNEEVGDIVYQFY